MRRRMAVGGSARRQCLLSGRKAERIIFAVSPDLECTVACIAREDCVSVFISLMLVGKALEKPAEGRGK